MSQSKAASSSFELVIFGGLGDLAVRKLLPALYRLDQQGSLGKGKIIILGRRSFSPEESLDKVKLGILQQASRPSKSKPKAKAADTHNLRLKGWRAFSQRLDYMTLNAEDPQDFKALSQCLSPLCSQRLYYLATASSLFSLISQQLQQAGLINDDCKIVLEKPIGYDWASAMVISKEIETYFSESQVYRIDHYLGKETVQNLLVLRFANTLFESQWNQHYIDHIQITISESIGVEARGEFYDRVGAFRDMLQNHLLQLLCMVAMEPPAKMEADAVRDEKVKVIKALKPILGDDIDKQVIRGQYAQGIIDDHIVPPYRQEPEVDGSSQTETFVAMKVEVDNWRWAGVPFYLRTGKRLASRACEIVVQFKQVPHAMFSKSQETFANKLVFRLQPDEGVQLQLAEKRTGSGMSIRPMTLSLNPEQFSGKQPENQPQGDKPQGDEQRAPEAYERLLLDAFNANPTLFLRADELMEAWRWVDPILAHWQTKTTAPESYNAGSWGPTSAALLLAKDGREWDEPSGGLA